jgi:hypothetical protein
MRDDLWTIFSQKIKRRSDKWRPYFDVYERHFGPWRFRDGTFVEVGVQGGGSLEMWREYFARDMHVVGIDIDHNVPRVPGTEVIIGDQANNVFWDEFLKDHPKISCFLDDGSHVNSHQLLTFCRVWPHVEEGGVFICEDTHTSYYENVGGGLHRPGTFIEFTKNLIDALHMNHIAHAAPTAEFRNLTADIGSLTFYDSQVVVTKGRKPFDRVIVNDWN